MGDMIRKVKGRISSALSVPLEVIDDVPRITFDSNTKVYIENFKGITEYTAESIMINAGRYAITLTGENLEIKNMNSEEAIIEGIIKVVDFS